ncbi:hypothetical protein KEM54_002409 [Ascosphaera aggregata]|nr:hypothetical protein KEM54_002409 [Ascosphaera aggregata]
MRSGLFQGPQCLDDESQAILYLRLARFRFTLPESNQIPKILITSSESAAQASQDDQPQLPASLPSCLPSRSLSPLNIKSRRCSDEYILAANGSALGFAKIEEFEYDGRSNIKPFTTIFQTLLLAASLSTIGILAQQQPSELNRKSATFAADEHGKGRWRLARAIESLGVQKQQRLANRLWAVRVHIVIISIIISVSIGPILATLTTLRAAGVGEQEVAVPWETGYSVACIPTPLSTSMPKLSPLQFGMPSPRQQRNQFEPRKFTCRMRDRLNAGNSRPF